MSLQTGVQIFAVIHLTSVGLSHVLAHRAWAEFFLMLREKGQPGVLVVGLLSLGFGSIIAAFHPVWSGIPLVLTLYGWVLVLKGLVYVCAPSFGLKKLDSVSLASSKMFAVPGVAMLILAAALLWHLLA